jgi:hypothetical protein
MSRISQDNESTRLRMSSNEMNVSRSRSCLLLVQRLVSA